MMVSRVLLELDDGLCVADFETFPEVWVKTFHLQFLCKWKLMKHYNHTAGLWWPKLLGKICE